MSKITCYNDLIEKIDDKQLKKIFIEMTNEYDIKNLTSEFFDVMNIFINVSFANLEDKLKMILLSQPEFWIFYIKDKEFLEYVKEYWVEFKDLINNYNEEEMKKEYNNDELYEQNKKNIDMKNLIFFLIF
jgi:DNA-directed RNA polymerase beta' subunit